MKKKKLKENKFLPSQVMKALKGSRGSDPPIVNLGVHSIGGPLNLTSGLDVFEKRRTFVRAPHHPTQNLVTLPAVLTDGF